MPNRLSPLAAWRTGRLALPDSWAGERMEAAFQLVDDTEAEVASGLVGRDAVDAALAMVGRALADQRREAALGAAGRASAAAAPVATVLRTSRRRLAWAGGVGVFGLLLAGLMAFNLAPRGADGLPTGNLPEPSAPAVAADAPTSNEPAALDRLRTPVADDPEDTDTQLRLAARLLQEPGGAKEAEALAAGVLDQRGGTDPDALLLLGLAQVTQGEDGGAATLRRYLDVASPGHPGVGLATSLLEGRQP